MKKELTVSAPITAALTTYTGTLISDCSFQELSDIIEKISNNKEELTDGMRQAATVYADTWDKLVVQRLNSKVQHLDNLQQFFSQTRPDYYNISMNCNEERYDGALPVIPSLISMLRSGDNKTWHKFADQLEDIKTSVEEVNAQETNDMPCREDYFEEDEREMGYDDRLIAQKKFELEMAKYRKANYKRQFKVRMTFVRLLKDIVQDPDIKEMLKVLKEQKRKANSAQSLVHEKSALVKLAINFSGTELLKALQELHDFQKKL